VPTAPGVEQLFHAGKGPEGDTLRELLKRVPNAVRADVLQQMAAALERRGEAILPIEFAPCTWAQLQLMSKRGITMGAHTVTHPILSRLATRADKETELLASKARLEYQLDQPVEAFAYPNGGLSDYDSDALDIARRAFRCAVTAIYGMNVAGADPHQLLRLPCDPDLPVPALARMLAGPLRQRVQPQTPLQVAS
jgi:peptidoglycan/xylan/chitin deacetylase (PgdA/CDA1 family)